MSPVRGSLIVAGFTIRHLLGRRRVFLLFLLSMVPAIFGILARTFAPPRASTGFVQVTPELFVAFLVPIISLLMSSNVIRDAIDDRTVVFILSTPVGRKAYAIGSMLGAFAVSAFALFVAAAGTWAGWRAGLAADVASDLSLLWGLLRVSLFGLILYVPFHSLLGAFLKFPTVIGIVAYGVLDLLFASLPGVLRKLGPSAYLEALLDPSFTTRNSLQQTAVDSFVAITQSEARLAIPLVGAVFVLLFLTQMSRRDLI